MRILSFTLDRNLIETVSEVSEQLGLAFTFVDKKISDINIILEINKIKPHALIIDDEYFLPNTVAMIDTVRQFSDDSYIIFVTENQSVELGRELNPYRIHSYHIKPIDKTFLIQSLESIKTYLEKKSIL
ncbi:MAG: hypothetical protein GXO87_10305 [Chlorobi bacterium]|nr:hypothetical protein [Chlorobiota bacterium]